MHLNETLDDPQGNFQFFMKDSVSSAYIPPQKRNGKLNFLGDLFSMILMPDNIVAKLAISISLNFLWGSMKDMTFLTLLSLISISVPGIAKQIMKVVLKFLYLDILQTEEWLLPWLISEDPLYYNFEQEEEEETEDG